MGGDEETSKELESKASKLIDGASDDEQLDEAANILAEAERLKGPLDKAKPGSGAGAKTREKSDVKTDSRVGEASTDAAAAAGD